MFFSRVSQDGFIFSGSVYENIAVGSDLTLAFVDAKLKEHRIRPVLDVVHEHERVTYGPFDLEFVAVNHSIPDAMAVFIHTAAGSVLATGDFKMDFLPIDGRITDLRTDFLPLTLTATFAVRYLPLLFFSLDFTTITVFPAGTMPIRLRMTA